MRVCLIIDSKFPTQKAYGITTLNTLNELSKLELSPILFCANPLPDNQQNRENGFSVTYYPSTSLTGFLKKVSSRAFGRHSRIAWILLQYLNFFAIAKQVISLSPEIIWTRDQPIPFYISKKLKGVHVIEIHKKLSDRRKKMIKKLGEEKVILCPISSSLKTNVVESFPAARIVLAPMGIQSSDISEEELLSEIRSHYLQKKSFIKIGYFGKLSPSGVSKGFEDLIDLGAVLKRRKVDFKLVFVGIDASDFEVLENATLAADLNFNQIEVVAHQVHSVGLQLMKECDFLVLPRNRDPNYFGFPLKALEYVASGRFVLAAKTQVNSELFSGTFQPFWYEPDDIQMLADLIQSTQFDSKLGEYLISGFRYANEYSWESRTERITHAASQILKLRGFS
jgi:glycosyltransferase involved in cell wall biosynthesis